VTQGLKFISQRERPCEEKGKEPWNGRGFSRTRDSFPSGHATVVWSLAPVIAHQYADNPWVAPVAYAIATMTSLSRINDDRHWASDAFFGSVVGYVTARLVVSDAPKLKVVPDPLNRGVVFNLEF
jgi:membrane-associated phospholipid phosphatase